MSNQPQPKKHNAFELVYVKDGYYYGSYDLFPSDNDTKLIKIAVWKGFEKPEPIGPVPAGKLDITRNGTYDIADKAEVDVNVPGATTKDLFEATANGEYDIAEYARVDINVPNPSTGTLEITENGEYNVTEKAGVNVNVPNPSTGVLNINANGEYDVTEKASVAVNVPNPSVGTLEITENGEYDVKEKAGVSVNVAGLVPAGNKQITTTAQTDVTEFATAQVVDANLLAENIKKDVTILGITGTLTGSGDLDELMQETF